MFISVYTSLSQVKKVHQYLFVVVTSSHTSVEYLSSLQPVLEGKLLFIVTCRQGWTKCNLHRLSQISTIYILNTNLRGNTTIKNGWMSSKTYNDTIQFLFLSALKLIYTNSLDLLINSYKVIAMLSKYCYKPNNNKAIIRNEAGIKTITTLYQQIRRNSTHPHPSQIVETDKSTLILLI